MAYRWKAIPESIWTGFALAFAGLTGALMVAYGAPEYLTAAVTAFIGAGFRLVIALVGAILSDEGTVTMGGGSVDTTPIPPTE